MSKNSKMIPLHTDTLYTLLDPNYKRVFQDKNECWDQLIALDKELTPGCIYVEKYKAAPARNLQTGEDSRYSFPIDEETLVFRCKSEEGAVNGARILNKIFSGSGTEFVAEEISRDGVKTIQIRSNIDKSHWEKLCVFCKYRFDREKRDPEEAKNLNEKAQADLNAYTKGTDSEGWKSTSGIPACIAIMGLHGNLRPPKSKKYTADVKRIENEINKPHPRGNPHIFSGVILNANIKNGEDMYIVPYDFGVDVNREALKIAGDGKGYPELLLETFGGNPFDKDHAPSRRAISGIGLALGTFGLLHASTDLIGIVGPAVATAAGAVFFVVTYVDHRWKVLDRISVIKKNGHEKERTVTLHSQETGQDVTVKDEDLEALAKIHQANTRDGGPDQVEDWSSLGQSTGSGVAKRIIASCGDDQVDPAHAALYGQATRLR